jgi:hypothetical protein
MLLQDPEPRVQFNSPRSDSNDSSDSSNSSNASDSSNSTNLRNQDLDLRVTNALMCLCMLVVMQDTSHILLYKSLIMYYLAVRRVDEKSKIL